MKKILRSGLMLVFMSLFLSPGTTWANVSLKNGNFFIGYTDMLYPGGFEPKIERIYNSKTGYKGIFGFGWGTEYEGYLTVSADGSVVVYEYGGGAENRFIPKGFTQAELKKAVAQLVAVAKALGMLPTEQKLKTYQDRLMSDAVFRNDEWERFVRQGKVKPRQLKPGTKLTSNRFSFQVIEKIKEGYRRSFDNGRFEFFDSLGKLARIQDKNNNFIKFTYGKDGKIQKIEDNSFRKMYFTFNHQGFVEKVEGDGKKVSEYKYNGDGELVYSKDAGGNEYRYQYSGDSRHNLTKILYSDKTSMEIAYFGQEKNENVKSIRDRDGMVTEYFYENDRANADKFSVAVKVSDKDKKVISDSRYDYEQKRKPSGESWTYRMVATIDGDRTDTTYNECCGLPVKIKRGTELTEFDYDGKGRVTKKVTPMESVVLKYDDGSGKVARVDRLSKVTKKKTWSEFKYDNKGNLKFAKNSEKQGVQLFYDRSGRIAKMVDHRKREIQFKYNEHSKPIEIRDPKVGTITVAYSNTGEVKKVDSSSGRKIALEVTSAFQNLLDIIRPAGVTLSF